MAGQVLDELVTIIRYNTSNRELRRAEQQVKDFTKNTQRQFQSWGQNISKITRAATVVIGALGAGAFKVGAAEERSLLNLRTQLGLAAEEVESLKRPLRDISKETNRPLKELNDAIFSVKSAGLETADALVVMDQSAKAAASGLGETKPIALLAGAAVNSYGAAVLDGKRAVEILLATVKAGNLDAAQLATTFGRTFEFAAKLGVGVDEVGTAIAGYTRGGQNASQATDAVRMALTALLAPSAEAEKILSGVGLSVEDVHRHIREEGFIQTIRTLSDELEGDTTQLRRLFGDVNAVGFALSASGPKFQDYIKIQSEVRASTGSVNEGFEIYANSSVAQADEATNNLRLALSSLYNNVLAPLLQLFGKLPSAIQTVVLGMGAMQIASTIGLGPSIGGLVTSLGRFIVSLKTRTIWQSKFVRDLKTSTINVRGFVASLSLARVAQLAGAAATGVATAATWAYTAALRANPVGAVIAAIALALVAAAVIVRKYWEPIKAFFIGLWEGLQETLQPIKEAFGEVIVALEPLQPVLSAIGDAFGWVGDIIGKVVGWFTKLLDPVDETSRSVKQAGDAGRTTGKIIGTLLLLPIKLIIGYFKLWIMIIRTLITVFTWLRDTVGKVLSTIKAVWNWAKGNWPLLVGILLGPFGIVGALIWKFRDQILGAFREVWDWLRESPIFSPVIDGIQAIIDFVRELPGRVLAILKDIPGMVADAIRDIPGLGGAIKVFTWFADKVGKVVTGAAGGVVPGPLGRPVPAIIHGGEMVLPTGASNVLAQMLEGFRLGPAALPQAPHYYGQMYRSSVVNRTVNINITEPIVIQTQATDAKGIAEELHEAIEDKIRNVAYDHDGPVER